MAKVKIRTDKVRASRDGHEFHENWAARKALQLIFPKDDLVGIAVEGVAPEDQKTASAATIEIADLAFYYGKSPRFDKARAVHILQLKYSIAGKTKPFRCSDASKIITKFAKTFEELKNKHGAQVVLEKLHFEIVTNRPILPALETAILGIQTRKTLKGEAKIQADQFRAASGLNGMELVRFVKRLSFTGLAGSLSNNKVGLSRAIANWSGGRDPVSRVRLAALQQLLRDKAGTEGENKNLIRKMDVLATMDVEEDDLFPCPESFPNVGAVVKRDQLSEATALIAKAKTPLLIHASGGVGKTVFLQSIASELSKDHEVLVFDCFGGGAYRSPEDGRHLAKKGLAHIANNFARSGLCDPLIPSNNNTEDLLKAFRLRLSQCVEALRAVSRKKKIFLFLDAADNAAEFAEEQGQPCFPKELLKSFAFGEPISGVQLVLSCRPERKHLVKGEADCQEFELKPFTIEETGKYLAARVKNLKHTEIRVAHARSDGNPRILEHLALGKRGLLDPSEIGKKIKLDEVLTKRIEAALADATKHGHTKREITSFLAGLSVLPPPVPIEDFAAAQGMEESAIKSFAVDLVPMLEKTKHGIWFRDEPTETLIRRQYGKDEKALHDVATNLLNQQNSSVYAARALPGLLQRLGDGKRLLELAFSTEFPASIKSTVGKQSIRYARLKSAVAFAAGANNYNHLVRLLIELSTTESVNQRGMDYILKNPDLIVACRDIDATRRLFECRTPWKGTRHARLTIAHLLQNEVNEAARHAVQAFQWTAHYFDQKDQKDQNRHNRPGPEFFDIAAIGLYLISQRRFADAVSYMSGWNDDYCYQIGHHVFNILEQSRILHGSGALNYQEFIDALKGEVGLIVAALGFSNSSNAQKRFLIAKLAKVCAKKKVVDERDRFQNDNKGIHDGLLKAAALALSMGQKKEALAIVSVINSTRPPMSSFSERHMNPYSSAYVLPFVCEKIIRQLAQDRELLAQDILPSELHEMWQTIDRKIDDQQFKTLLKDRIDELSRPIEDSAEKSNRKPISHESKSEAHSFLYERMDPLVRLVKSFGQVLACPVGEGDTKYTSLANLWFEIRKNKTRYRPEEFDAFFDYLGQRLLILALSVRTDLSPACFVEVEQNLEKGNVWVSTIIEIVCILAKRPPFHVLAGTMAKKAAAMIEVDDDVASRASLHASLAHAILPANRDDAEVFFRKGLDQMEVIGSGDYDFVNGLLEFASSLKGGKLNEREFHTFTNMCELNIYDVEKFGWAGFGTALSKVAGLPGTAKLARWDDRSKASFEWSLMPFVTALLINGSIAADLAVSLLRLCDPIDTWYFDFSNFATAIAEHSDVKNRKMLIQEFCDHYKAANRSLPLPETLSKIMLIVEKELGSSATEFQDLSLLKTKAESVRTESNGNYNFAHGSGLGTNHTFDKTKAKESRVMAKLVKKAKPDDWQSVCSAIEAFQKLTTAYFQKSNFFQGIRGKVNLGDRSQYLQTIANHETFNFYWKLHELAACKAEWTASSSSLDQMFREVAAPLLTRHADDLISHGHLSRSQVSEIAKLSGIGNDELTIMLIERFASPGNQVPGTIWMALASMICEKADADQGQLALSRLFSGNAAKLSTGVVDGPWKTGLYPRDNQPEIAAGLVWVKLGSPSTEDRWRAAHTIRSLARLDRWDVIRILIAKFNEAGAGPFQAPELMFYLLHAKLWLLIALARVALDYPKELGKSANFFKKIALDTSFPHVLLREFAARIVLNCATAGHCSLQTAEETGLKAIHKSTFPSRQRMQGEYFGDPFYQSRPDNSPEPKDKFSLEYDFRKNEVGALCRVFGKVGWEVNDIITKWVRKFDPKIEGMYSAGGREKRSGRESYGINPRYHTYGEYLGWHGLFLAAGTLLSEGPVVNNGYEQDAWSSWVNRKLLTRDDGLWLSDGTELPPLNIRVNLLSKGTKSLELTGQKEKLLDLICVDGSKIEGDVVVDGSWKSYDGIQVKVSSALVSPAQAKKFAIRMARNDPNDTWMPEYNVGDKGEEYLNHDTQKMLKAWIVSPSVSGGLDEQDPWGSEHAMLRSYFSREITQLLGLKTTDPFKNNWQGTKDGINCTAQGWRSNFPGAEERVRGGNRLKCSPLFVHEVLNQKSVELLIFISLERYENERRGTSGRFSYSSAVLRISPDLSFQYYGGWINRERKLKNRKF